MNQRLVRLATAVIERASRDLPADAVLRGTLKAARGLMRREGAYVSRAVFSYYRWFRWLEEQEPVERRLQQAVDFAERFALGEETFSVDELLGRAIPDWTGGTMTGIPPGWLRALQREPRPWLRARRGMAAELIARLGGCRAAPTRATEVDNADSIPPIDRETALPVSDEPADPMTPLPEAWLYTGDEDLFRTREFQDGQFELQDVTSQAVGLVCAPKAGETWWDACAGEGGKTLHLSDQMENRGLIWATDRAEWRLKRFRLRAARAECFNYRSAVWDGGARLPTRTRFDGVLVDAPCSNIGTWGRNPHARWTTTPADPDELGALQMDLLSNVVPAVKPGGRLIFSVCTLSQAETVNVTTAFEWHFPEFEPVPVANPFRPGTAPAPQLWLWPQDTGGNGMFIAVWRRKG